ncbi:hypothetical protein [Rhizobium sp. BT-175]|uniref:hypothetical protein n=1 Tax=Rhizobium sp. BT-175 TaxID=2986929 RepID=UPI002235BE37|nr:hypothetical protein [Rhizobium sp. BT-175]MCV9947596.1 hypothetical protein [Rhizobium sp. BT-175]
MYIAFFFAVATSIDLGGLLAKRRSDHQWRWHRHLGRPAVPIQSWFDDAELSRRSPAWEFVRVGVWLRRNENCHSIP